MLCASNKALSFSPSAPSRGSSAGLLSERSISMWLSLIHWARKNCLANYRKEQNYGKTWKKKKKITAKNISPTMKAESLLPSEFNQFATAFCKIWFLLSERSSLQKKKKIINLDTAHVQSM